jgi:nitroimidazol reductase NimA-like FMN-containing flavoprotein (pyridoxamine 5'-phosphate oxidase superfamily)
MAIANSDRSGTSVLTTSECLALLRSGVVGRLAVSINELPDIFPVNYVVDHGCVVFRTAGGTKLAAAVLGRGVAFEADGDDPVSGEVWSVIVKGHAVEIDRPHDVVAATDLPLHPWHIGPKPRFVRIEPVDITGRRFRPLVAGGSRPTVGAGAAQRGPT